MAIKIELADANEIKEIVTAAILTHLGPEKRDELIKGALKMLLETKEKKDPRSSYGTIKYSPLEEAFEQAAIAAARDIMHQKFIKGTEAREKLDNIIDDAITKWLGEDSQVLVGKIIEELGYVVNRLNFSTSKSRY